MCLCGARRVGDAAAKGSQALPPKCFCIGSVFVLATLLSMMVLNYVWGGGGAAYVGVAVAGGGARYAWCN